MENTINLLARNILSNRKYACGIAKYTARLTKRVNLLAWASVFAGVSLLAQNAILSDQVKQTKALMRRIDKLEEANRTAEKNKETEGA